MLVCVDYLFCVVVVGGGVVVSGFVVVGIGILVVVELGG